MTFRTSWLPLVGLLATQALYAAPSWAHPPATLTAVTAPAVPMRMRFTLPPARETLVVNDGYYELSVGGLRTYIESIRQSEPQLYAQLDPTLARLETRRTFAIGVFVTGIIAAATSVVFAFLPDDCQAPDAGDPMFREKVNAWEQCGKDHQSKMVTFSLLGLGALAAGTAGGALIAPGRSDLLSFVNEHNRATSHPLRLQVGYDAARKSTYLATSFSF